MRFALLFLLLFSSYSLFSQITEGVITYSMELYDEENEAGGAAQLLERSEMVISFSGNNTRTSVKSGEDTEIATILNAGENKGLILMSGLLGNIAITANYTDLAVTETEVDYEIEFLEQTKEILGYTCKKAKITHASGAIATYWYTDKIVMNKIGIDNMTQGIPGVPLQYKIDSDGSIVTFTAESFKESLKSKNAFSTAPPEGYKVLTFSEFETNGF